MLQLIRDMAKAGEILPFVPRRGRLPKFSMLTIGADVQFASMTVAHLDEMKFSVAGEWSYQFDRDRFTAWELTGEGEQTISMIVADSEGEEPYLAISRALTIEEREHLFEEHILAAIMAKPAMRHLDCRHDMESLKGWLNSSYTKEIDASRGKKALVARDVRTGAAGMDAILSFRYFLLTDETGTHAIEIEQYDEGRVEVYATIFRRAEDIVNIAMPRKRKAEAAEKATGRDLPPFTLEAGAEEKPEPKMEAKAPSVEAVLKETPVKKEIPVTKETLAAKEAIAKAPKAPEKKPEPKVEIAPEELFSNILAEQEQVDTLPAAIPPAMPKMEESIALPAMSQSARPEWVSCDMRVASRLIDEAERRQMPLADVVRRVLDLPLHVADQVMIPFPLGEGEYRRLAERYAIDPSDRDAIRNRAMEELRAFAGKR